MADTYKFSNLTRRKTNKILVMSMSSNGLLPTMPVAITLLNTEIEYKNINYTVAEVLTTPRFGERIVDRIGLKIIEV